MSAANPELGATREIWLSPSADKASKNSFLIRDDAYAMQEGSYGRQLRLGRPIDLGPAGSWTQSGWFGGNDQERWQDEFMYAEGGADTSDRIGRIRLWPGLERLVVGGNRANVRLAVMTPGASGSGENTPLICGEKAITSGGGSPTGGFRLYSVRPQQANAHIATSTGWVQAISVVGNEKGDSTGTLIIGYSDGTLELLEQSTGTITSAGTAPGSGGIGFNCIAPYNGSTYYTRGRSLIRRTYSDPGVAHTVVKHFGTVDAFTGMTVWQNRLWFMGLGAGGSTTLYVSDGVTAVAAVTFPPGFSGFCLTAHYGSLYIGGSVDHAPGGEEVAGQLWRYNGSSLTKLWDARDAESDGEAIISITSHDRYVVWPRHGNASLGTRAGLWYYDAEEDAILEGPTLDMDPASAEYIVTGVTSWNDTVALAMLDPRLPMNRTLIAFVRKDGGIGFKDNPADPTDLAGTSFEYEPATITRSVTSSMNDADLPGEEKLLLSGLVRAKVPQGTRVRIGITTDSDAEVEVATITYDAGEGTGWRNVEFDLVDGTGAHLKATEVSYTVYVENTDKATYPTNTPEVDLVALRFLPAAKRRATWYVRVIASDGQDRVDGTAQPLTTRQAILDELSALWRNNEVLAYWDASTGGTPADGDSVKVIMSNFSEQSYRLDSEGTAVRSEVGFSLMEIGAT